MPPPPPPLPPPPPPPPSVIAVASLGSSSSTRSYFLPPLEKQSIDKCPGTPHCSRTGTSVSANSKATNALTAAEPTSETREKETSKCVNENNGLGSSPGYGMRIRSALRPICSRPVIGQRETAVEINCPRNSVAKKKKKRETFTYKAGSKPTLLLLL